MIAAVGEHGYHGTRVADVVWRAGVSRKTFYELFSGKDDCFAVAYSASIDRIIDVTFRAYDTQTEWADRLRAALTALLGLLAHEPALARVCFVEAMGAGENVVRRRDDGMRLFGRLFDAPGAPDGVLGETLRTGRVGELGEVLRLEITAGRGEGLPGLVPDLMCALVLPYLGADGAQRELDRVSRPVAR